MLIAAAAWAAPAWAHRFSGSNELGGMIGGQIGAENAPGGFKFFQEYGYRFSDVTWLNLQLNFALGGGNCYGPGPFPYYYRGCGFGGNTIEMIGGVKLKFSTSHERLVPYAKVGGGFDFIFFPPVNSNGIAVVVRGGGGVKYYVLRQLAVGGEMDISVGPAFYSCGPGCNGRDTVAYFGLDIAIGVEFNF